MRAPQCGFSRFEPDDQALDLLGQLVGVAHRPARAVAQGLEPMLLVAIEDLVAGLAGDAELPAHIRHRLTVQQTGHKAKAFFHHRTLFPRHQHLPPPNRRKVLPMCPVRTVTYVSGRSIKHLGRFGACRKSLRGSVGVANRHASVAHSPSKSIMQRLDSRGRREWREKSRTSTGRRRSSPSSFVVHGRGGQFTTANWGARLMSRREGHGNQSLTT